MRVFHHCREMLLKDPYRGMLECACARKQAAVLLLDVVAARPDHSLLPNLCLASDVAPPAYVPGVRFLFFVGRKLCVIVTTGRRQSVTFGRRCRAVSRGVLGRAGGGGQEGEEGAVRVLGALRGRLRVSIQGKSTKTACLALTSR